MNSNSVVISGASQGIGEETLKYFTKKHWKVFALSRNRVRLRELKEDFGDQVIPIFCDLTNSKSILIAAKTIKKQAPLGIDGLVNNAGQFFTQSVQKTSSVSLRKLFEVNFFGHVELTQQLLALLILKKGTILNVSSTLGFRPTSGTSAYAATKAALNCWTQSLALELGPSGVRVNAIAPGIVDTPIHAFHFKKASRKTSALKKLGKLQPLGRIGKPEEIAASIFFLMNNQSSWTTGAILNVDGGINLL